MKRIAIIDTETGGLNPASDPLLEVGVVLWSVEHRATIACASRLILATTNGAEDINRIPLGLINATDADDRASAMAMISKLVASADVIAAHRAEFDRGFLPELADRPWLCTKFDMQWPGVPRGASLNETSLALLGYAVRGHRALADCLTLAHCFEKAATLYDLDAELAQATRPRAVFEVADSSFNAQRNEQAKAAGFRWDATLRSWRGRIAIDDAGRLPFEVRRVSA